jgi:hypothetical protein
MGIDPGYYVEEALWLGGLGILFLASSLSAYACTLPWNKNRVKTLQKVCIPVGLCNSIAGFWFTIDLRGVFGIYKTVPILQVVFGVICVWSVCLTALVWLRQMLLLVLSVNSSRFPQMLIWAQDDKVAYTKMFILEGILIVMSCIALGLMSADNVKMKYLVLVWVPILIGLVTSDFMTAWCLRTILEADKNSKQSKGENANQKKAHLKVAVTLILLFMMTAVSIGAIIYHLTAGIDDTFQSIINADPEHYTFNWMIWMIGLAVFVLGLEGVFKSWVPLRNPENPAADIDCFGWKWSRVNSEVRTPQQTMSRL